MYDYNRQTGNRNTKKSAFTLAEVLITLGIIGVIAAMTIPALIANTQKQEFTASLKKAYSEFNQVLAQMAIDNGCPGDLKCTGVFTSMITFGNELVKYYKVNKNCKTATESGCFVIQKNYYDGSYPTSIQDIDNNATFYKFVTADGMSINIQFTYTDCNKSLSTGATGNMSQTCGFVNIDVNGLKPPNLKGRDTFDFWVTNGKGPLLYPRAGADDNFNGTNYWWKDPSTGNPRHCTTDDKQGTYCAGRIIEEGWQMNY